MEGKKLEQALAQNEALARRNPHLVGALRDAKSQRTVRHELAAAVPRKKEVRGRLRVCLTSCRARRIDPDNICPKYLIDCLRTCGAIPGDSFHDIEVVIRQRKAAIHEQGTLIEIIPI
jgi:hypothetical protein